MINMLRNWLFVLISLLICVVLLGLIYKIEKLEEANGELRQFKKQYEKICSRYGGWNCE